MSQFYVLPRERPEEVGISPSAVTAFLKAADHSQIGLHSFMLLRHGQVAAEACWAPYGPQDRHMLFSLSKSFTSTAVGLAVTEGRLSVDDYVVSFFPERAAAPNVHLRAMRVRHLLSMSTGHAKDSMGQAARDETDWVQAVLTAPVVYEPGTRFVYNSGATYMLSAIVQRLTGQTLLDYLQPRLFEPLAIEGATWDTCPLGINTGGWGLSLKIEDIARFGQLYLQNGKWNGTQLLPQAWVEEATSFHISNGDGAETDWKQGYGYQFWRCRHGAYRGDGAFGQFCVVMPEQDAVVAVTAGVKSMQEVLNLVWEHLLPGMSMEALPANDEDYGALVRVVNSLAYVPLRSDISASAAECVSGKRYVMNDNKRRIKAVSVRFDGDECLVTFWNNRGEQQIRCGIGRWIEGQTKRTRDPWTIAASGSWRDADTFTMEWRFVQTPFTETVICRFEDDRVEIEIVSHLNMGGSNEPFVMRGRWE